MPTNGRQRGGGVITNRAIAAAREPGNLKAMNDLFLGITRTNFRWELVDLVFFHLQPHWMEPPPLGYEDAHERKERETSLVRVASFCLSKGIGIIILLSFGHQRNRISEIILHNFDNIKYWITRITPGSAFHDPSHPLRPYDDPMHYCRTLNYMLELDVDGGLLSAEVKNSPEIVEFAVAAWAAIDPLRGRAFLNSGPSDICPTMCLLYSLFFCKESRQIAFELLYSPGKRCRNLRAKIIESAISRCRTFTNTDRSAIERRMADSIAEGDLNPPESGKISMPSIVFRHMDIIMRVMQGFSEHPDMRKAIRKSVFFEEYMRVLHVWLVDKSDRKGDKAERDMAFQLLYILTCLVERWPSKRLDFYTSTARYWKVVAASSHAIVRGGFVPALVECLQSVTMEEDRALTFLGECMKWLRDACNQDPTLAQLVYSQLVELLGGFFWRQKLSVLGRQNEHILDLGLDLAAGNLFSSERQHFPCDNLQCEQDGTPSTLRVCAGCRTVTYCSPLCQEVDCKALHRSECRFAELDSGVGNAPYRQSLRQRHALLVARRALIELTEDESLQDEMDASPSVLVLNDIPDRVAVHDLEEYMKWRAKKHIGCPESVGHRCQLLDQRVRSLLELYESSAWEEGQYLVSATYQVGRRTALLLVMMQLPDSTEPSEAEGGIVDDAGYYGESCTVSYCGVEFICPSRTV